MFIGCSRCEIVSFPEIRPRYDRMALDCWYGEELREREREKAGRCDDGPLLLFQRLSEKSCRRDSFHPPCSSYVQAMRCQCHSLFGETGGPTLFVALVGLSNDAGPSRRSSILHFILGSAPSGARIFLRKKSLIDCGSLVQSRWHV